jgi:tetratricopeptide (TPR) repeat protein
MAKPDRSRGRPGDRPEEDVSGDRPESGRPDERPDGRPDERPDGRPDERRDGRPDDRRQAAPADERETAYELLQRGNELLRGRHHAQAAVVLERAARLEPRKGSVIEALARAYYNSGQHARAADAFTALLEIDPTNHYGRLGLGLSLERLGRLAEARTHLRLAVAMDPGSETYRRALERLERKAG